MGEDNKEGRKEKIRVPFPVAGFLSVLMVLRSRLFVAASSDLVDIHAAVLFQSLHSDGNYLRIQDNSLRGAAATVDEATPENMRELVRIGGRMLTHRVSRVNVETGRYEEVPGVGSNADALAGFARQLSEERRSRLGQRGGLAGCSKSSC